MQVTVRLGSQLFRLGPQAGPHLLLRWIREKVSAEDLEAEWEQLTRQPRRKPGTRSTGDLEVPCASCLQSLPVAAFPVKVPPGVAGTWDRGIELLKQGAWRMCLKCAQVHKTAIGGEAAASAAGSSTDMSQDKPQRCDQKSSTPDNLQLDHLRCDRCDVERPLSAFSGAEVRTLQAADALWRAACLHCTPQALRVDISQPGLLK